MKRLTNAEFVEEMSENIANGRLVEVHTNEDRCEYTLEELKRFISILKTKNLQVDILNALNECFELFGWVECDEYLYCESDWGEVDEVGMEGVECITGPFIGKEEAIKIANDCNALNSEYAIGEYLTDYFNGYTIPYDCADWYDAEGGNRAYSRNDL